MKQKIFVLYTGGTIGMTPSEHGLTPDTKLVSQALQPFAENFHFDWHICSPLIDSSAVRLTDWQNWLDLLAQKLPQYDGVLILHGTDTMAYTANLLALALQNLDKPIVVTGSQWPYGAPESDAPLNLATAAAAFQLNIPHVMIAFNGKLFQAVGSSKTSTQTTEGFSNPHFGAYAVWQPQQGWNITPQPNIQNSDGIKIHKLNEKSRVICCTLIPGCSAEHFSRCFTRAETDAVIIHSFGHGNAPSDDCFIEAVRRVTANGGIVLNISQVPQGCAAAVYAQGSRLREAGAISGGKCNLETAVALLTLAVSNHWRTEQIQQKLNEIGLLEM